LVGFFICLFSLCTAFLLVGIDAWAAKKDGVSAELSDEDKFRFGDLKKFNKLPFWLVTASCVIIYMVIFPYIQYAPDMLETRYGFKSGAGAIYALPYIISGILSPILGIVIDRIGKRALFIMTSSVLILVACVVTILIPASDPGDPQWLCLLPLILLGIGYSVYAAALWGCIPYTVTARLVGTAYGMCTAVQNVGLFISPWVSSQCLKTSKQDGYFWLMMYYCVLAMIGIFFNVWLYFDDLRNRGGILDKVDDGENLQELMTTPVDESKRRVM
jgi:MFS family permease